MKIGSKSLLFGGHQFVIHPLFVLAAWVRVCGQLPGLREIACIIIHDWGYWGKPNMDGKEGESHPEWGAQMAYKLFGTKYRDLILYHSRFMARSRGQSPSRLCLPDKVGVSMMPTWLWVVLARASGELGEYLGEQKYRDDLPRTTGREFFDSYKRMVTDSLENGDLNMGIHPE